MVDFSWIGKAGIIFQYEDCISTIGFNIARELHENQFNEKLCKMSLDDILRMYFDREIEDVSEWLKQTFDLDFPKEKYLLSKTSMAPNMLYSYRIIDYAKKDKNENFVIHSNDYSPLIEEAIKTYHANITYTHGDIVPVLQDHVNWTFVTSNTANIRKCLEAKIPIALTMVDDYMYLADLAQNKIEEQLRDAGIYAMYTSIVKAGIL